MSKVRHTLGPWTVNRKVPTIIETESEGQGMNIIAMCTDPDGIRKRTESEANARLIAAAPELLEVVQATIEYLQHPSGEHLPASAWFDLNEQARAVIAKVKGE